MQRLWKFLKSFYTDNFGNEATLIWTLFVLIFLGSWVLFKIFVDKNDPMHFKVIEYRTGQEMTVKRDPGHYWLGINKAYSWEWSNAVWFSEYGEEGGKEDESVGLQYINGAQATQSGIMVYAFNDTLSDKTLIDFQDKYYSQENFENKIINPLTLDALTIPASMMTDEESYTTRKKEYGYMAYDQLQNGIYATEIERDYVTDFTGDTVMSDIPKVVYELVFDDSGKAVIDEATGDTVKLAKRNREKSLRNIGIDVLVLSLYEPNYFPNVDKIIAQKTEASLNRTVSTALTKLENRKDYLARVRGQVRVDSTKWAQKKKYIKDIVQAQIAKDTLRIKSETRKAVAKIQDDIGLMKKEIGELKGEKELEVRQLRMGADGQLFPRIDVYVAVEKAKADAYAAAKGIYPKASLSSGGVQGAWDVMLYNQGKQVFGGDK